MARRKCRNVDGKTAYIDFTPEEEIARDAEEAEWEAGRINRDRNELIDIEMERLRKDEESQLRIKAEDTLRQLGQIT